MDLSQVFVYHRKPAGLIGDTLFPLNHLKARFPDAYTKEVAKYKGREWLLDIIVPSLNCLWNDVLHFSLMHPSIIFKSLAATGTDYRHRELFWYEIPLADLIHHPSILYINSSSSLSNDKVFLPSDFEPVTASRVRELSGMPEINLDYYRESAKRKEPPLLWMRAPHLLVKGAVIVRDYQPFDWRPS